MVEQLIRNQQVASSNLAVGSSIHAVYSASKERGESGGGQLGAGCETDLPFDRAPESAPIQRYSGAVWVSWPGAEVFGGIISEDDYGRSAKGFRNRWRYTITGPASIGLPVGCSARWVKVRARAGGLVVVTFDDTWNLSIVPGDPEIQERVDRVAPVCELNRQLVDVANVSGRWRITIEEPATMPETRTFCGDR